jgi:hypothetical protein
MKPDELIELAPGQVIILQGSTEPIKLITSAWALPIDDNSADTTKEKVIERT